MSSLSPDSGEPIVDKEVVDSLARELLIIITDYYQSENTAKGEEEQTI